MEIKPTNSKVKLANGQIFDAKLIRGSRNRYRDGVDWIYFETLSNTVPDLPEQDKDYYYRWATEDEKVFLTGWVVKESCVIETY